MTDLLTPQNTEGVNFQTPPPPPKKKYVGHPRHVYCEYPPGICTPTQANSLQITTPGGAMGEWLVRWTPNRVFEARAVAW